MLACPAAALRHQVQDKLFWCYFLSFGVKITFILSALSLITPLKSVRFTTESQWGAVSNTPLTPPPSSASLLWEATIQITLCEWVLSGVRRLLWSASYDHISSGDISNCCSSKGDWSWSQDNCLSLWGVFAVFWSRVPVVTQPALRWQMITENKAIVSSPHPHSCAVLRPQTSVFHQHHEWDWWVCFQCWAQTLTTFTLFCLCLAGHHFQLKYDRVACLFVFFMRQSCFLE